MPIYAIIDNIWAIVKEIISIPYSSERLAPSEKPGTRYNLYYQLNCEGGKRWQKNFAEDTAFEPRQLIKKCYVFCFILITSNGRVSPAGSGKDVFPPALPASTV